MRVGILGSGDVGRALGNGFLALGHEVRMGAREAGNPRAAEWVLAAGERGSAGTFAAAAEFGDVVVLATAWSGTENALALAGPDNLAGKVVIDATNPLAPRPDGPPGLALGHTDSGGEQVQRWLPGARVVKAFNIVGNPHMFRPDFPGGPPDMFICGNDESAKVVVTEILTAFGWPVTDIGGIEGARLLEPLCILWVTYGVRAGSFNRAFKVLRR
ncbi:MAG TPA: NAD(P)-binding domain-containing protein [Candidatus Dormibacteraeota bacterium]